MTSLSTARAAGGTYGRIHRKRLGPLLLSALLVSAVAWAALAGSAAGGHVLDHRLLGQAVEQAGRPPADPLLLVPAPGPSVPAALAAALLGWLVMVAAMMLPPALPMLAVLQDLLARHRRRAPALAAGVAAFAGVWALVGLGLLLADLTLHASADRLPWLAAHPGAVVGTVLVGAGLYQFSPLKQACLRACRSPRGFAVAHWQGRRAVALEAATVTGTYALSCAGCCWALMTVTFATTAASMAVMVLFACLMAAERLAPGGQRLVRPVGALLIVTGLAVLIDLVPTGLPVT